MENIHLAIVEDDPVIRESLESYLEAHPALQFTVVADSVEHFLAQVEKPLRTPQIDLLLLDIGLPGMSGIEGIRHIRQKLPEADIVMLTTFEEEDKIFKSLCSGACSYISKRTPLATIQEAIFTIHRGGSFMSPSIARKVVQYFMPKERKETDILSPRQQQIVQGLVDGLSYKLIADKLSISIDTVRDHIKHIYRALEVNSKAEVIRKALEGEI
ncbi:MAG: response regulator transcription factor [Lewinellaceae bacterium]|nr:response regulator transcription factor [Lewinellaceae bacterium]